MEKVTIADAAEFMSMATAVRPLTDALGATDLAINHYELEPGDAFSPGLHRHLDQEEVFYVQSGTATFETGPEPDETETVRVDAGEVIRFEPGEYQNGRNDGDERVVALTLGAPADSEEGELLRACPDCGERTRHGMTMAEDGQSIPLTCLECGTETGRMD